jgi:hypothetical protein
MNEFYTNLRILSQDLYKHSQSKKSDSAAAHPRRNSGHKMISLRQLSGLGHSPSACSITSAAATEVDKSRSAAAASSRPYFGADSMHERVKKYAQEGGIPSDYLDRYIKESDSSS